MTPEYFTPLTSLILFVASLAAGVLGALVGIGGGIIIVPLLTLTFGLDIKYAVAASLVAVVASSTASGSVYVGKGLTNMRLAMVLEVATTLGAITGGLSALYLSAHILSGIFSMVLLLVAFLMFRKDQPNQALPINNSESKKTFSNFFYDPLTKAKIEYQIVRWPLGLCVSFIAGILSGMLGVGGGFLKVPAMNLGMKVPIKVATATSNFMIGVTAVSSLFIYFTHGYIIPLIAAAVAIGIVIGAFLGTRLSQKISPQLIKKVFAVTLAFISAQMMIKFLGVYFAK